MGTYYIFRLAERRVGGSGEPWYVGWSVCQPPVAQKLHQLYTRPAFISPHSTPPKKPWIFIGEYLYWQSELEWVQSARIFVMKKIVLNKLL